MNDRLIFGACDRLKSPRMKVHLSWIPHLAAGLMTGCLLMGQTLFSTGRRCVEQLMSALVHVVTATGMPFRLLWIGSKSVWKSQLVEDSEKKESSPSFNQGPPKTLGMSADVKMEAPPRAGAWYYFLADTVILFQHSARLKGGEDLSLPGEEVVREEQRKNTSGQCLGTSGGPLGQHAALGYSQNEMASTCTNPVILSMICPPVDQSGQESDWSTELEEEEEEEEGEGSLEWLGENEGALLSDWSTDWEDSDGDDDEEISCEADDLWESFFVSDDPYNPLNFSARAGPPPQRTPNMADTETPAKGEKIPSVEGETTAREKTERNTLCHSLSSSSDSNKETDFSAGPNRIPGSGLGSVLRSSHEGLWEEGLEEKEGSDWDFPSGRLEEDCPAEIREAFAATEQQDSDGKKPKSIKKVRFSPNVELHRMITWSFAYRAARKGPWEECGRDRCRFQRRIAETETIIGRCFEQKHRDAVWAELYAE